MRSVFALSLVMLCLVPAAGCRRRTGASPEYAQAKLEYDRMIVDLGDDAYAHPSMARVEQLLGQVPAESADSPVAKQLLARIADEKKRIADEAAAAKRPGTITEDGFTRDEDDQDGREETGDAVTAAEDAGPNQPVVGMPLGELLTRFSRCFEAGPEILVTSVGMRQTFQLRDIANCRDQHPDFARLVLIIEDGKVGAFGNRSQIALRLPDGGVPSGAQPAQQQAQQQPASNQPSLPASDQNVTRPEAAPSTEGQTAKDYDSIKY